MPPFLQNILALPAKTKAVLGVSAVAILAIAFIMLKIATAPSYALIASGLDPAQTGKITAALDEQGIAYELQEQRHGARRAEVVHGAGAHRARRPGRGGFGRRHAARQRAARQVQARRFAVPAAAAAQRALEGEVAKTHGRRRGRHQPARADRDAAGRPVRRRGLAGHGVDHARQLRRHAAAGCRPRHGAARRGRRQGPQDRQRDDHRRQRRDPLALRRRRLRRQQLSKQAAETRYARQMESTINAMLAATLGPGKAQVKVNADLNMDETTAEAADVRRQGRAADVDRRQRDAQRAPARPTRPARRARVPTSRPTRARTAPMPPARATTSPRRARPPTASTRRSPTRRSPAAPSTR